MTGAPKDLVAELREDARIADTNEFPEDACRWAITMREAADEIERLRLFEHFANSVIEGQVEDAIAYKMAHGKYPFED